ncbi:MAG: cellulase family glycosylhydrolase [Thermomicrobiales bacterium]|nr:cellulase family glycosylhydrolase [Thermomicrobiales bacterium]
MDTARFDRLARFIGTRADRRTLLGGLAALLSGSLAIPTRDADAKKKRCGDCKKSVKGKCKPKKDGSSCKGGTCQKGKCKAGGKCVPNKKPGANFTVSGRQILDPNGNPVLLRGVNKMFLYDQDDPTGVHTLPEIAKSKSNTVRIVWGIASDQGQTNLGVLESLIVNARDNHLLPMIELHDATGDWSGLGRLVNYWTQPKVAQLITKYQHILLINIGNEVGDSSVTDQQFIKGYTDAVKKMRCAGIHTPLVIDAPDFGKNLEALDRTAGALLAADPDRNLIFSVHTYWGISDGANAGFIKNQLDAAELAGFALIVGEFSKWGAYNANGSMCEGDGEVDYVSILRETHQRSIGWYAWEWGPGNEYNDAKCAVMNMTTNGTYASLQPAGWARETAVTSPYSIWNNAQPII